MRFQSFSLTITILVGVAMGCSHPYEKMKERELATGVRSDSLFLGFHLGMSSENFYQHCYKLNRDSLIWQGGGNLSVQYKTDDLKYPAVMNFYPEFTDGVIANMPVTFQYEVFEPWNPNKTGDSLQIQVLGLMKSWYGDEFVEIKHPTYGSAFVNVRGNRQISVYKQSDARVGVYFKDLTLEDKETEEEGKPDAETETGQNQANDT